MLLFFNLYYINRGIPKLLLIALVIALLQFLAACSTNPAETDDNEPEVILGSWNGNYSGKGEALEIGYGEPTMRWPSVNVLLTISGTDSLSVRLRWITPGNPTNQYYDYTWTGIKEYSDSSIRTNFDIDGRIHRIRLTRSNTSEISGYFSKWVPWTGGTTILDYELTFEVD